MTSAPASSTGCPLGLARSGQAVWRLLPHSASVPPPVHCVAVPGSRQHLRPPPLPRKHSGRPPRLPSRIDHRLAPGSSTAQRLLPPVPLAQGTCPLRTVLMVAACGGRGSPMPVCGMGWANAGLSLGHRLAAVPRTAVLWDRRCPMLAPRTRRPPGQESDPWRAAQLRCLAHVARCFG